MTDPCVFILKLLVRLAIPVKLIFKIILNNPEFL